MYNPAPIEILESRIAPAAIVTVELTAGALVLKGDAGDASVKLTALDDTHYLLETSTDTTFSMGTETGLTSVLLTGPLKSLAAEFGAGSDSVSVFGADFKGDLAIDLGDGTANSVLLDSVTGGSLTVTGGTGADVVATQAAGLVLKGGATFDLGSGDNGVTASGTNFLVGKDLAYTGGAGIDGLLLASKVAVKGSATIDLGAGNGTVAALGASFAVGKKLSIDGSAALADESVGVTLFAPTLSIGGDFEVKTGAGEDSVTNFTLGGKSSIKGNVNISTGAGDDTAIILLYGGKSKGIVVDGGEGTNMIGAALAGASTGSIQILGGDDTDTAFAVVIGGKAGSIDLDLAGGDNSTYGILASASAKSFSYLGGDGFDNVIFGGIQSKLSGNVTATVGAGAANFTAFGLGGGIGGTLKLDSTAATTDSVNAIVGGAQTTLGGLDLNVGNGNGIVALQPDLGSIGSPTIPGLPSIPGMPGGPGAPSLGGLLQGWTVKGAATVTGGDGQDTVQLNGAGVTFAGGLALNLGAGSDTFGGSVESLKISKLDFRGGAGADAIELVGQGSLGAATIDLGEDGGAASFSGLHRPLVFASLKVTSAGEAGEADALALDKVRVSGKLDATFGAGSSSFKADNSTFGSTVNVSTGAGEDQVAIDTTVSTGYATTFTKAVDIDLGDDSDILNVGGDAIGRFIITKATFKVDGGAGVNTMNFDQSQSVLAKAADLLSFV